MRAPSSGKRQRERELKQAPLPRNTEAGSSPLILLVFLGLLVVGATLFAHWPALSAQALSFDDSDYLTENQLVRHPSWESASRFLCEVFEPSTVHGYYQPLTMISLMLDYAAGGRPGNLRPFHRTSLVLHAANTALVIVLLYMLIGQPWIAAMVGLLFGVHPMTVETIPWIGERKTLLAAFFALWCLIVYVRYARRPAWKPYVACVVLYFLALISKPTSTPLPLVLLLLDFWPLRRLNKRAIIEKLPFLAIGVAFSAITVISQARTASVEYPGEFSPGRIPLILCHNIIFYLYKIVWPAHLSSHYPFPQPLDLSAPMVLAGVIGTCVLIPGLLISVRWTRALLTGWLIFFVAIFPTMGVLGFTIVIASDKYAYLPAVGLLLVVGWALERAWTTGTGRERRAWQVGTAAAVVLAAALLTGATRRYLGRWESTEGLFNYMIDLAPGAPILYNNRGNAYCRKGDYNKAIRDYTAAIELKPDYARACYNRGIAYGAKDDNSQAILDYSRAIELKPNDADAYCNRGVACAQKGRHDQAILDYNRAIKLKPDNADIYFNRAVANYSLKQYDKAWADVKMCRHLGGIPQPAFVRALIEATGRTE